MHQAETGAFTGEVSAPMLREIGVHGVVLGRRSASTSSETDRAVQAAGRAQAELRPILCVGETEEEREAGDTERKLRTRSRGARARAGCASDGDRDCLRADLGDRHGKVATPDIAQDAIAFRARARGRPLARRAARVPILYGGSVKPDNCSEILAEPDVDGALVGSASLDPDSFARIVASAA